MKISYNVPTNTVGLEMTPSDLHALIQNLHGDLRQDFAAILERARRAFTSAARALPRRNRK
jgi:hypothetical protein